MFVVPICSCEMLPQINTLLPHSVEAHKPEWERQMPLVVKVLTSQLDMRWRGLITPFEAWSLFATCGKARLLCPHVLSPSWSCHSIQAGFKISRQTWYWGVKKPNAERIHYLQGYYHMKTIWKSITWNQIKIN